VTAVQAHALRAAAEFIEQHTAAAREATVGVSGDGHVRIVIHQDCGPVAARIRAVAAVAEAAGATAPSWSALTRSLHSSGELAGHRLSVATYIHDNEPEGQPS
jgi:Tfp pilus assembly protein PilX